MSTRNETIAAVATPPGRGSIGVVRISGANSGAIALALTGKILKPRSVEFVSFKTADGELIDKGVALFFQSPTSYTGEDVFECHLHGNSIVLDALLDEVYKLGSRPARPGEFTERAFLNNKLDLLQAEAVADLIDSHSRKAARKALQSMDGIFSQHVNALREDVFKARALLEAALDFPEEDIEISVEPAHELVKQCLTKLNQLIKQAEAGRVLEHAPVIVIAGPPNVGKSSIINFLAGVDVAIVSDFAGTTRDTVKEQVQLDGHALTLIDTAGLRDSVDSIEQEGISRAHLAINSADIVLMVSDLSRPQTLTRDGLFAKIQKEALTIHVRNKSDICCEDIPKGLSDDIFVSAKTGAGMRLLQDRIIEILEQNETGENVIFARQRHIDALNSVCEALQESVVCIKEKALPELITEKLRLALSGFDEITGKTVADDVLGKIFAEFCIGK